MTEIRVNMGKVSFFPCLFVIIMTLLSSCGEIDKRLKVTNGTNNSLYYKLSPDSSYSAFLNEIERIQYGFKNDSAPVKTYFYMIKPKNDTITEILHGNWEKYMSANHIESLWIFILNDSLSNNRINSLSDLKNTILFRKSYDIGYLKKNNWIITITE